MKGILRFELKRAFFNRTFLLANIVGILIVVAQFVCSVLPLTPTLDNYLYGKGEYPLSVFNTWIGGEGHSIFPLLYNLFIPFLAVLPFVESFYVDHKSGYIKNICIRVKKENYFFAKGISVFISAGFAVVLSLILNIVLTSMVIPTLIPDASTMTFPLNSSCMLSDLFYKYPYVYILIYLIIFFIFAGLIALTGLVVSFYSNNRIFVSMFPFMLYILSDYLFTYINYSEWSIRRFLRMDQPYAINGVNVFIVCVVSIISLLAIYIYKGKKYEAV